LRFTLSFRDVEDLLAEREIAVSYETVRRWVNHFGPMIAADLRKRRPRPGAIWHLDEAYLKIAGRMVYLWRRGSCGRVKTHKAQRSTRPWTDNVTAPVRLIPAQVARHMVNAPSKLRQKRYAVLSKASP
jgi:hypothetical protein